jgi:5-epi-alpha-selinene synthase
LLCPFTSALNPGTEAAHRHTSDWAQRFGLVSSANIERQIATEQFTWLVGGFYPWAERRELELISDFTSWLFWHDDVCDETAIGEDPAGLAEQFGWFLGVLTRRKPVRPENAFDQAFADLRDRFEAAAPSWGWFARVVTSIQQYFEACVWEAVNRQENAVPSVDMFVAMRRFAGGMYIYLDFIELVLRAELPLVVRAHPEVVRLAQITNQVACWHNDVFSLHKEVAYGDVHNLVVVIAEERAISLTEARALAVKRCNRKVAAFAATAQRVPSFGKDADRLFGRYKECLGALMRGNYDWSIATQRYRQSLAPQSKVAS